MTPKLYTRIESARELTISTSPNTMRTPPEIRCVKPGIYPAQLKALSTWGRRSFANSTHTLTADIQPFLSKIQTILQPLQKCESVLASQPLNLRPAYIAKPFNFSYFGTNFA